MPDNSCPILSITDSLMYLLINTLSPSATYLLFNSERKVVSEEVLDIHGRESEYFLESLLLFLERNSLEYKDLEGVVTVNGPGSFTAMRIITLTLNTLSLVHKVPLYSIDSFALGELSGWRHPILIRANRGEYLLQEYIDSSPKLVAIPDLPSGSYFGFGEENDFANQDISIESTLDYESICRNITLANPVERMEPLYIKKPNIT